jgi:hypothetical protein
VLRASIVGGGVRATLLASPAMGIEAAGRFVPESTASHFVILLCAAEYQPQTIAAAD